MFSVHFMPGQKHNVGYFEGLSVMVAILVGYIQYNPFPAERFAWQQIRYVQNKIVDVLSNIILILQTRVWRDFIFFCFI